ncbi:papain family cysteine protease [Medicago truncatula]|uniref:Papain family cysteine protease n=1 Tax=Medicago truncatula TaxID=3880 RepID=A0A072URS1_MEDTR|nr:papain family cysteine protease [Medicago truncatula]
MSDSYEGWFDEDIKSFPSLTHFIEKQVRLSMQIIWINVIIGSYRILGMMIRVMKVTLCREGTNELDEDNVTSQNISACWAFATAAAIESTLRIYKEIYVFISKQELLDKYYNHNTCYKLESGVSLLMDTSNVQRNELSLAKVIVQQPASVDMCSGTDYQEYKKVRYLMIVKDL